MPALCISRRVRPLDWICLKKITQKNWSHGGFPTVTVHGRLSQSSTSRIKHVFSRIVSFNLYPFYSIRESMIWFFLIFFCSVCFRVWSGPFFTENEFCRSLFVAISPDSIGQGRTGIIHQIERWKINKLKLFRVPLFCRLLHYCHEKWAVHDPKWPHVTFQFHLTRGAW